MGLTAYTQDALLQWLRGVTFPAAPATLHASFHEDDLASGGAERSNLVGGRWALSPASLYVPRDAIEADPLGLPLPGTRQIGNVASIVTPVASGSFTLRTMGFWTASSGGTMLLSADVVPDMAIISGSPVVILAGDLVLRTIS